MGIALPMGAAEALITLVQGVLDEPQNLTSVQTVADAVDLHLADSLAALTIPEVSSASDFLDLGSGGGFPGLPLAIARPDLAVTLVEAERRKADWLRRASGRFPNVRVVNDRSEILARRERERWQAVGIRAVSPPPVALELAAPLVAVDGSAVLWRGERRDADVRTGDEAAAALGFGPAEPRPATPFPSAKRHFLTYRKHHATDDRFPRRPGRAAKRPLA